MTEFYNILTSLTFILLHFFLFAANFHIMKRKIIHPAVLFSLLWFVILLAHFVFSYTLLNELYPLHTSTYLLLFIGVVAFSAGSFLQTVIWQKNELRYSTALGKIQRDEPSTTLRYILLAIIAIGLPFYIIASYRLFLISNIDNFFVGLRTELVYGNTDIGLTKYLISLSFVVFAVNLYAYFIKKSKRNLTLAIFSFLITITYVIFFTGRGLFLMILAIYVGIAYLHNKNFSFNKLLLIFGLFILLFISFGIIYGKGGSKFASLKENIEPVTETTAIYLVSSLNALDLELQDNFDVDYSGNNSLRLFKKIAEKLGLVRNAQVVKLEAEFVTVPYPTNVFTVYSPYLKDFGRLYAWIMIAIFGFLHTWLYEKAANTKSLRYSLYYSFLLFPLLISFFMDFYLSIFSTWVQVVFYTEVFSFFNTLFVTNVKEGKQ